MIPLVIHTYICSHFSFLNNIQLVNQRGLPCLPGRRGGWGVPRRAATATPTTQPTKVPGCLCLKSPLPRARPPALTPSITITRFKAQRIPIVLVGQHLFDQRMILIAHKAVTQSLKARRGYTYLSCIIAYELRIITRK